MLNPLRAKAAARVESWKWSSYKATAGLGENPSWLAVEWVLSQFGKRRYAATKHYQQFVREGLQSPSIWADEHAQVLLGDEAFVEKLKGYVTGSEEMAEIPRDQRYLGRPGLKTLFAGKLTKSKRDAQIVKAVHRYGYSQNQVADCVNLHYATVSRLANPS